MDLVWKSTWVLGVMFRHIHRRARPHFVPSRVKASISTSSSLPAPIPSAVNQASEASLSQTTTDEMTASHSHPTLPSFSSTQLRAAHHVPQPGYGGQSYVFSNLMIKTKLIFVIEKERSIPPTPLISANIFAPTASLLLVPNLTKRRKRDV